MKSATARMEAAREVKGRSIDRELCLVSLLSRMPGWAAHLCEPLRPQVNFPLVVCLHTPAGRLTWRIHEEERPLFAHLAISANDAKRDDYQVGGKDALLMLLAIEGWAENEPT